MNPDPTVPVPPTTQSPFRPQPPSYSPFQMGIAVFVLVLVAGGFAAFALRSSYEVKESLPIVPPTVPAPAPVVAPDLPPPVAAPVPDYTGWSTYTNETYGFQLQYPKGWAVKKISPRDPVTGTYAILYPVAADTGYVEIEKLPGIVRLQYLEGVDPYAKVGGGIAALKSRLDDSNFVYYCEQFFKEDCRAGEFWWNANRDKYAGSEIQTIAGEDVLVVFVPKDPYGNAFTQYASKVFVPLEKGLFLGFENVFLADIKNETTHDIVRAGYDFVPQDMIVRSFRKI